MRSRALVILFFFLGTQTLWANGVSVDDTAAEETVITLKVELCPDPRDNPDTPDKEGPTPQDIQDFIDAHKDQITSIWNACPRRMRIRGGAPRKTLRFVFEFTVVEDCDQERDPNKQRYQLHLGKPPPQEGKNADSANLWMDNTSRTVAHEMGHTMGLGDEYDYEGGTRENLMGRGSFTGILPHHLMTILFTNADNPNEGEQRRRSLMKTLLRMQDQRLARRIAADNDITKEQYDAYKGLFDANGTQVQPGRPSER